MLNSNFLSLSLSKINEYITYIESPLTPDMIGMQPTKLTVKERLATISLIVLFLGIFIIAILASEATNKEWASLVPFYFMLRYIRITWLYS